MRKLITIGLAAMSLAASAGVGAASAQPRPYGDRDRDGVPNVADRHDDRYDRRDDRYDNRDDRYDNRYGRWDNRWGRYPAPPPRHWRHHNGWYGHVRACQVRYRSYSPARDMYFSGRTWVRCRL
jgi:hypothetical protein